MSGTLNNTQAVLSALMNRLQDAENAAWGLLSAMSIGAATNDLLDKIGKIVGEPRLGRSDVDYRAGIRIAVRVNISSGRATDIIAIMLLVLPASLFQYLEGYPAMWMVDAQSLSSGNYIAGKLHHARAAGTYGLLVYSEPGWSPSFLDCATSPIAVPGVRDSVSGGVPTATKLSAALAV